MKKLFSLLLSAALILTVLLASPHAAAPLLRGARAATAFAGGSGTEADPYLISTAAELALLASGSAEQMAANYLLTADIDLSGYSDWTPIGNETPFSGCFDGGYHTVRGLRIEHAHSSNEIYFGLFGNASGGTIRELNIENAYISVTAAPGATAFAKVGTVAARAGSVESCIVKADISNTHGSACGIAAAVDSVSACIFEGSVRISERGSACGIAETASSVVNCCNKASVKGQNAYGIADTVTARLVGCVNRGAITADKVSSLYSKACGIASLVENTAETVVDCTNIGNVRILSNGFTDEGRICGMIAYCAANASGLTNYGSVTSDLDAVAGGVFGQFAGGLAEYCVNYGDVTLAGFGAVGGVTGIGAGGTIQHSYNYGTIRNDQPNEYGTGGTGGICGNLVSTDIYYCANFGDVYGEGEATGGVGGFLQINSGETDFVARIEKCYNTGNVSATSFAGGIAGKGECCGTVQFVSVLDCYNTGSVTGTDYIAGIVAGEPSETGREKIARCYNIGVVNGVTHVDAISAYAYSTIQNCYYHSENGVTSAKGISRTLAQLESSSGYSGFNFNSVWTMAGSDEYPYAEIAATPHGVCDVPVPDVVLPVPGDADGDRQLTIADALLIMRHAMSIAMLPPDADCDMDGDGTVSATDAIIVMRAVLNM